MTVQEAGKKGGFNRAKNMTAEERSKSAQKASRARWANRIKQSNKTK